MPNFNKVVLVGHLVKNPDVRTLQSGTSVADTSIAVTSKYGEKEDTMFVDIVAYGKTAEIMGEYCTKGQAVLIEGSLKQNVWEQEGQKRSKHYILIERVLMLGKKNGNSELAPGEIVEDEPVAKQTAKPTSKTVANTMEIKEEDVPF